MKIVQTYYSYADNKNPIYDTAGFLTADMNWKSMAVSCLLLKKHYGSVTLYCNGSVKEIVSELKIPYDEIVVIPDFMQEYKGCNLWALPKIYTYSQQKTPFLHVDCDCFMFDRLSTQIEKSDVIGQNIEYDDQYYNKRTFEKMLSYGCEFPLWIKDIAESSSILRVINAGVLGGQDISFIQEYVELIKKFIHANVDTLRKINDGFVNSIYEQLFLYILSQKHRKEIGLCTVGDKLSTKFDWLPMDFSCSPKTGYMHMLAGIKRQFKSYVFVSQYLHYINPTVSNHITKYCYEHNISPLINFPELGIFLEKSKSMQQLAKENNNESKVHEISTAYDEINIKLSKDILEIFQEQSKCRDLLWSNISLLEKKVMINPKCKIISISHEDIIRNVLHLDDNILRKVTNIKDLAVVITPDATLGQPQKLLLAGVKMQIIWYLQNVKNATFKEIKNCLEVKQQGEGISKKLYEKDVDKVFRSLVYSNILVFS